MVERMWQRQDRKESRRTNTAVLRVKIEAAVSPVDMRETESHLVRRGLKIEDAGNDAMQTNSGDEETNRKSP